MPRLHVGTSLHILLYNNNNNKLNNNNNRLIIFAERHNLPVGVL